MCFSDLSQLVNEIDKCDSYAGILNQLATQCAAINAITGTNECYIGTFDTDLVASIDTVLEISDAIVLEVPVGILVGNTVVTNLTGRYFINVSLTIPSSAVVETMLLNILVNGVPIHIISLEDDGVTAIVYGNTFDLPSINQGDIISVSLNSPTGVTNVLGRVTIEAVYGV